MLTKTDLLFWLTLCVPTCSSLPSLCFSCPPDPQVPSVLSSAFFCAIFCAICVISALFLLICGLSPVGRSHRDLASSRVGPRGPLAGASLETHRHPPIHHRPGQGGERGGGAGKEDGRLTSTHTSLGQMRTGIETCIRDAGTREYGRNM